MPTPLLSETVNKIAQRIPTMSLSELLSLKTQAEQALEAERAKELAMSSTQAQPKLDPISDLNSLLDLQFSPTDILLFTGKIPTQEHAEFIKICRALISDGYKNSHIYKMLFQGGMTFLRFIFDNHAVLTNEVHLNLEQIIRLMSTSDGIKNTEALLKHHTLLKDKLSFTTQDMITVTGRSDGARNLEFLSHYADNIRGMVKDKRLNKTEILSYFRNSRDLNLLKTKIEDYNAEFFKKTSFQVVPPKTPISLMSWNVKQNTRPPPLQSPIENFDSQFNQSDVFNSPTEREEKCDPLNDPLGIVPISSKKSDDLTCYEKCDNEMPDFLQNKSFFVLNPTPDQNVSPVTELKKKPYSGTLFAEKRRREGDNDSFVFPLPEFHPSKEEIEEEETFKKKDPLAEFENIQREECTTSSKRHKGH